MNRLPEQPGERLDRSKVIRFTFDGKSVEGYEGDTVGSALYAAGQRTLSRSFKYHRRRGLMCCAGQCPNCIVAVDGDPGVRACIEPAREGMRVQHVNAKPGLEFDVMRATDLVGGPFTPPGFYYKTFIRPRRLWPVYEKILRHAAGLGVLPAHQDDRKWRTEYRRRHADVLVIGGGLAGLRAAARAAELGADVVLVDEGSEPGGTALFGQDRERIAPLLSAATDAGVEILSRASALGYFDGIVPVWQGQTLHQIRARSHVFATGALEQPLLFAGNDLPGVMLSGGALRLARLYAVSPGSRAVIATASDRGLEAAATLHETGVWIAAVADLRPINGALADELRAKGIEVLAGHTVIEARGSEVVSQATLAPVGQGGGSERTFDCDLLVVSGGSSPATSLLSQAGAATRYDASFGHFALGDDAPPGVHAAGEVAGVQDAEAVAASGALAGMHAAHELGFGDESSRVYAAELVDSLAELGRNPAAVAIPPAAGVGQARGKCFACLCEDVTTKDIARTVAEGYDSIELAKRYTTVTMGPCQGRMCQLPSIRLMAEHTGQSLANVGTTTARPPWTSVPMGVLAGRPFEPAKRSAIHWRHRALGASINWAGDWRRAYDYGDPQGEALAVHESAGLIDVSTLGKLLVSGPEAGEFLDRLYPNRFSNLKPGRIRYGVISSDAGRIVDDGTICRLEENSFYVTTTSSGAGAMEEWFSWWLADWGMQVHLTDLTQGLAAVNLAGPRAREIMGRVSDRDYSNEAFPYLDGKQAQVAGVPCLILRIGFVGEVGYEIHFASAYGEHLWDGLLKAGSDLGIRPFGLEPQRILRLQKMHIL
ncbi:MAG TPA: 2Fe-2S iron-sulfur cluster-binding protein, partial [Solirubrobacteraceae bacterium]